MGEALPQSPMVNIHPEEGGVWPSFGKQSENGQKAKSPHVNQFAHRKQTKNFHGG